MHICKILTKVGNFKECNFIIFFFYNWLIPFQPCFTNLQCAQESVGIKSSTQRVYFYIDLKQKGF